LGTRPGDDYNARGDWFELLSSHGWILSGSYQGEQYWKRPGKDERGWSATVNHAGLNLLYVFSSNAAPFESGRGYSLFSAYALLEHGGDFKAATKALAARGYALAMPARIRPPRPGKPATIRPERPGKPETIKPPRPGKPETIRLHSTGKPATIRIERATR
jgi:hypothetical protein